MAEIASLDGPKRRRDYGLPGADARRTIETGPKAAERYRTVHGPVAA